MRILKLAFALGVIVLMIGGTATTADELGPAPACGLYTYRAKIIRVIDGDTVVANIDLGFRTWLHDEHLRLYGIDAPERGSDKSEAATQALRDRIEGQTIYICTIKAKRSDSEATGSFGRYLVTIHDGSENVNDWLVQLGLAADY